MRTWRVRAFYSARGRRMRGRARRRAAHHPTCARALRPQRAQAAPLAAAQRRALRRVRERERQPRRGVVPVERHRARLGRRRALARQERRYLRLDGRVHRSGRGRLVLRRRFARHREAFARRRRLLRVHALPAADAGRRHGALARRREVVHAAEREPDLPQHLRVVGLLVAACASAVLALVLVS